MPRPFLIVPDKRLRTTAAPIAGIDDEIRALWDEMLAAMYAMPGVGLAAPQIGVSRRVIVVDASPTSQSPLRMANPELLEVSQALNTHSEGSPNLPGLWADVTRPATVRVRFLDPNSDVVEREFTGLWATSVQHQIDHLNGKLFIDRIGPVKRRMLLAKHAKARRG